jgi:hypothetical protein
MGTLAVTEELHAKQQEAARKEAERAARKAPQDAAADGKQLPALRAALAAHYEKETNQHAVAQKAKAA